MFFGYGLVIPHYGTIVVNGGVRAGNYCVLHTSTCIGGSDKVIGGGLYLAAGAKKVYVAATHALLSKNATGVLNELPIEQIVVTDTIKHKRYPDRMVRISVDQLLARGIDYVYNDRSIHQIFDEQNRLK